MAFQVDAVHCNRESDSGKALQMTSEEHGTFWVPKSVIDDDSEVYDVGHTGALVVSDWFAEEKGWA
jgi:hypothetical protein